MRVVAIAGVAGMLAVFVAGARPTAVWETFQQIYPSDQAQRQALDHCFLEDHRFDRFDRAARDMCYRRNPAARGAAAAEDAARMRPNGNYVDLWRAAGQGHMPRNDVRFEEQMARYYHPVDLGRSR